MAQENVNMQANGMGRTKRMEDKQGKENNWKT